MKLSRFKLNAGWCWIAAIYASVFLVILSLAYSGKLPPILTQNDKLAHLGLYGAATYLGHRACNCRWMTISKFRLPLFPTLFTIFTVVEEALQSFSPNRTLDGIDLIASFAGIMLGHWLAERSTRKE